MPEDTESSSMVESPPPTPPAPASDDAEEARSALLRLAHELSRHHNRALLIEYLRLRRLVLNS